MAADVFGWIIGPHLIGLLFLILGLIQSRFPPKNINNYYGYRMPSSMKNQQNWDEANRYAGIIMIKIGLVVLTGGLAVTALMQIIPMSVQAKMLFTYLVLLMGSMGSALTLIAKTETHLDKFEKEKK